MTSLQPTFIAGSSVGLETDVKPFLLTDQAFQQLYNAYAWRERVKKRNGNRLLGRLRRLLTGQALGVTDGAGNFSGNIKSILSLETNSEIEAQGSPAFTITIGAQVFTETSPGILSNGGAGTGTINYASGTLTIDTDPNIAGIAITADFAYFPGLPVMGIYQREISNVNDEQTIFFDTKYAYIFSGLVSAELVAGTTWDGTDADFFWCTNYRGITGDVRLFFVTNNVNSATVPMRYYNGAWNAFTPGISGATPTTADTTYLLQAKILIPYYGRLIALNTTEGVALGGGVNFFNRCRFSQIGDPTQATVVGPPFVGGAWRSDVFGKGGFLDAPTNEAIVSAAFNKNTLIVFFERSTWQLRYVGEYGLPFLWERISSDFGSESKCSPVVFDNGVLAVGDKAIISANAVNATRIDEKIPDLVFTVRNAQSGVDRVVGIRDYTKELVYWTFSNSNYQKKFPNEVLVYNYRNNTFATFRDNVTFFGTFQPELSITWGRFDIFWNNEEIFWADMETQTQFPFIVAGNQQGFIMYYMVNTIDESSLAITAIDATLTPVQLTIPNHNLLYGDIIRVTGAKYTTSTDLNDEFYFVQIISNDIVALYSWDTTTQTYVAASSASVGTYIGLGKVSLHPQLYVATKDFNPYQQQGMQVKLSYIDFLMEATPSTSMTVELFINSILNNAPATTGNFLVGNTKVSTSLTAPFYPPSSQYAWHRFYATLAGQYVTVVMTYDDDEMNTLTTHEQTWEMNAFTLWTRPGAKNWA